MIPEEYLRRLPQLIKQLEERLPASGNPIPAVPSDRSAIAGNSIGTGSDYHPAPGMLDEALQNLVDRLSRHYPFHQSCYAGQMLKPPHPAAWLAYALAMTINPNNHALDGGPEASFMEKEVVQRLKRMIGFPEKAIGHLTSSGTIANLEALWVARELHPDRPVAISSQSHYTHKRMCQLLRHPVITLPEDADGLPDPSRLPSGEPLPGTVVVTMGTTGTGRVEPLHRILPWAASNGIRIHVDAAYGGFFYLISESGLLDSAPWTALPDVDSIVIDPHKHGLQPYGCGSVLFRDPVVGKLYRHDSPYTYFTSDDLHLGEISLECSRAGAAAVALWFTMQLLMPDDKNSGAPSRQAASADTPDSGNKTGNEANNTTSNTANSTTGKTAAKADLPHMLADCRKAALRLHDDLDKSARFQPVMKPELDIVTYIPLISESSFSAVSRASGEIMKLGMDAPTGRDKLYLSTLILSRKEAERWLPSLKADAEQVRVLRSVLMKPEHYDFVPELIRRIEHHCAENR